jgi:ubiquinone/menaquinone biosynthesis C-methylase UbiE
MNAHEAERLLLKEFGRMAGIYDRYSVTATPRVWRQVRRLVPIPLGSHALDLGCGPGALTVRLAKAVGGAGSAIGVDAARGMIEFARQRRDARGRKNLTFLRMDSRNLRLPEQSFDLVLSTFGLPYFARDRCLREAFRVLDRGGWFLCVSWAGPNPESKAFLETLTELRNRLPPPADVRRLALARRVMVQLPENQPGRGRPKLVSELRKVGFRRVRRVVEPVTVRFRGPASYVRYKATWGEYDRDLSRLTRGDRQRFVADVARRMGWSSGGDGGSVTWKLSFTTATKT